MKVNSSPEKGKPYAVMAKGFVLTVHTSRNAAQRMKEKLEKKYTSDANAVKALAKRNYRPFNQ